MRFQTMAIRPETMLRNSLGKKVRITTRTGKEYVGTLRSYDELDNLYLEDVEEVDGELKLKRAIFKGGNITFVMRV
jgi:small nuclear ribonucleoprotein (snRNP)-like protein